MVFRAGVLMAVRLMKMRKAAAGLPEGKTMETPKRENGGTPERRYAGFAALRMKDGKIIIKQ